MDYKVGPCGINIRILSDKEEDERKKREQQYWMEQKKLGLSEKGPKLCPVCNPTPSIHYVGFDSKGNFICSAQLRNGKQPVFSRDLLVLDLKQMKFVTYTNGGSTKTLSHRDIIENDEYQKKFIASLKKVVSFPIGRLKKENRKRFEIYARALFDVPFENLETLGLRREILEKRMEIPIKTQARKKKGKEGKDETH